MKDQEQLDRATERNQKREDEELRGGTDEAAIHGFDKKPPVPGGLRPDFGIGHGGKRELWRECGYDD